MISDITTEIFGKSGGSHKNVFGVEIELPLDFMVFMLPVMAYLKLHLHVYRFLATTRKNNINRNFTLN